jgi:hypothetical protein
MDEGFRYRGRGFTVREIDEIKEIIAEMELSLGLRIENWPPPNLPYPSKKAEKLNMERTVHRIAVRKLGRTTRHF